MHSFLEREGEVKDFEQGSSGQRPADRPGRDMEKEGWKERGLNGTQLLHLPLPPLPFIPPFLFK